MLYPCKFSVQNGRISTSEIMASMILAYGLMTLICEKSLKIFTESRGFLWVLRYFSGTLVRVSAFPLRVMDTILVADV